MKHVLELGQRYIVDDRTVAIAGLNSIHYVEVRDEVTGEIASVPRHKLQDLAQAKRAANPTVIIDTEWNRSLSLAEALCPYIDTYALPRTTAQQIGKTFGVTARHVQRLRVRFAKQPVVSTLARNKGGRPRGFTVLPIAVERLIQHCIDKYYARRERVSIALLTLRIQSMARRVHLKPPSEKAIRARVKRIEGLRIGARRLGSKAAKQIWGARPGQLDVERPLELVQIDHTLVDIMVLSPDRTTVLGRPWLSVALDVATRCVVGIYLSMDAPSSVSVAQCIAHAVLPKPENQFDHELWPMHGLMEMLHHDNGKDLRNRGLERGCEEHGIKLRWRPPLTPHFGGHIERMMGTLMKLIHGLKGTTYSNPKEKGDYASEDRATMTLPEVREWLVDAICRLYHARRHRELGIPPLVAWERAWRAANGGAIHPPVPARSGDFKMDFLPFEVRRLQRTGIAFDRTCYWHSDLAPFVGPSRHVICRYDPRDPMRIWVDLGDQVLIEAAAVAGRAIKSIATQPIDKVMQAHLNARIDKGFRARDDIEAWAATSTRRQRRSQPKRKLERDHSSGKRGGWRRIQGADASPPIQAPLIVPDSFDATVTDLGL